MVTSKPEQHEQEARIYQARGDAGVMAVREWLFREQGETNAKWVGMTGDDLVKLQGEAKIIARLIKVIDVPSKFKLPEA